MGESFVLSERDDSYLREVWILYGISLVILGLRFAVRIRTVGIRNLQWDDLFAVGAAVFITTDSIVADTVYYAGTNIEGVYLSQTRTLSEPELQQLYLGSKYELFAWYSYPALIWCLKGIMVCFFLRMTAGVAKRQLVIWLGYACILTYVAVFLTVTFGCWPIEKNFQIIPDPGSACTLKPQNFIVITVLNVITDAAILSIPFPLLWTLQVPVRQKVIIGLLLSSGVFVIAAAIIRIVITLSLAPSALNINRWGTRETVVGIIAVNAPVLRPLFTKAFWTGMDTPYGSSGGTKSHHHHNPAVGGGGGSQDANRGPYELAPSVHDSAGNRGGHGRTHSFTGSEECIIAKSPSTILLSAKAAEAGGGGGGNDKEAAEGGGGGGEGGGGRGGAVIVHTMYEVTKGPRMPEWDQDESHKAAAYGGLHSSAV